MLATEGFKFVAVLMLPSLEIEFYRPTDINLSTREAHKGQKHQTTKFQKIKFKENNWIRNWIQSVCSLKKIHFEAKFIDSVGQKNKFIVTK